MVYLFLGAISEQEVDEEKALNVFTAAKDDESLPIVTNLMTNEPNFACQDSDKTSEEKAANSNE